MVEPVMVTIRASGEIDRRPLGEGEIPTLEELQRSVGGPIQEVPYFLNYENGGCVAYCHEEGKLLGYPVNIRATSLWRDQGMGFGGDYLCGDVVVICGNREFLEKL